jgi:acyl-CoA synthetase (AMP-forming)/AMP-acid ligase II
MGDRTLYVPSHIGENVLPNLPFFHKLLRYAQRKPSRIAIRDVNAGLEKTYRDVLSDALALRVELEKTLGQSTLRELSEDKEVYIGLLAPGGYEYTVGFIAILAMGAAVVPMGEFIIGLHKTHN